MKHLKDNKSDNTLSMYSRLLGELVGALGPNRALREITPDELKAAMPAILRPEHSKATQEKHKRIVKTFFNWLVDEGHIETSPVYFSIRPMIPDPMDISRAITDEEVEAMLAAANCARDYAIVQSLITTAFQHGGLHNMRVEWIRPDLKTIKTYRPKTDDYHTVPLPWDTWCALREWIEEREKLVAQLDEDHGYLWVNLKTGERLTDDGLRNVLRRLGRRANVENWCAQAFRHHWGLSAARNGVPPKVAQAHLGHKSMQTTINYYYKVLFDDLRDVADLRARRFNGGANGRFGRVGGEQGDIG